VSRTAGFNNCFTKSLNTIHIYVENKLRRLCSWKRRSALLLEKLLQCAFKYLSFVSYCLFLIASIESVTSNLVSSWDLLTYTVAAYLCNIFMSVSKEGSRGEEWRNCRYLSNHKSKVRFHKSFWHLRVDRVSHLPTKQFVRTQADYYVSFGGRTCLQ